jgi:hypothetical protein
MLMYVAISCLLSPAVSHLVTAVSVAHFLSWSIFSLISNQAVPCTLLEPPIMPNEQEYAFLVESSESLTGVEGH